MKKLILACVTIGVAVGAGVWLYNRWKKDKKVSSQDEVNAYCKSMPKLWELQLFPNNSVKQELGKEDTSEDCVPFIKRYV